MLHGTPAREELRSLELRQIAAQRACQPRGGLGGAIPEQDHLAAVDLDHLDVVDALACARAARARARRA